MPFLSVPLEGLEEKEARGQKEMSVCDAGPVTDLAEPWGSLALEWPFRVVPSWAELSRPLYSH